MPSKLALSGIGRLADGLDVAVANVAAAASAACYDAPRLAPASILVVDDDPDLRELVSSRLWRAGYAITTAPDGDSALAAIAAEKPDLVVLDVMMPGRSGLDVCRELRADPGTADLPILILTARTHTAFVVEGFAAGANHYMTKPFSPRELVDRVQALLTR